MSNKTRTQHIIGAMSKAIEQGIDPFSTDFIQKHDITYRELLDVSNILSDLALAYSKNSKYMSIITAICLNKNIQEKNTIKEQIEIIEATLYKLEDKNIT